MVTVVVKHILVNECAVRCPACRRRNYHTVGPPGALISTRPWGHRHCGSRQDCPGYVLQPADNVLLYDDSTYTHETGLAAGNKAAYLRAMRQDHPRDTCFECFAPLVKQYLNSDGLPLSDEQTKELAQFQDAYARQLECSACGGLCFQSKRDAVKDGYNEGGHGLCRPCGGKFSTQNKAVMGTLAKSRGIQKHMAKIWSCPTHGIVA